ncbi:hypothetical protein BDN72DRAFT_907585 [Pluteus cervinus]|uniref:Uncharacterized protein n=1 Tax=Pluteus cervinus TaxID=181527 RepID=A0ACD2ZX36_9AGAR|nr:hypothetical protein BDN72DRAFT_907585 [Pluteus cervinus]
MDSQSDHPPSLAEEAMRLLSAPDLVEEPCRLQVLIEKLVHTLSEEKNLDESGAKIANEAVLGNIMGEIHGIIKAQNGGNDDINGTVTPVPHTPFSIHIHNYSTDPLSFSLILGPPKLLDSIPSPDDFPDPPHNTPVPEDIRNAIFKNMEERGQNIASYVDEHRHVFKDFDGELTWDPPSRLPEILWSSTTTSSPIPTTSSPIPQLLY